MADLHMSLSILLLWSIYLVSDAARIRFIRINSGSASKSSDMALSTLIPILVGCSIGGIVMFCLVLVLIIYCKHRCRRNTSVPPPATPVRYSSPATNTTVRNTPPATSGRVFIVISAIRKKQEPAVVPTSGMQNNGDGYLPQTQDNTPQLPSQDDIQPPSYTQEIINEPKY